MQQLPNRRRHAKNPPPHNLREIIASNSPPPTTSPHHTPRSEMGAGLCCPNDAPTARVFHAEDLR